MDDKKIVEKRVAREILNIMEEIYFSEKFSEYRVDYGSNGTRDLILQTIKDKYDVS